jgi:hypothetical protein
LAEVSNRYWGNIWECKGQYLLNLPVYDWEAGAPMFEEDSSDNYEVEEYINSWSEEDDSEGNVGSNGTGGGINKSDHKGASRWRTPLKVS